MAATIGNKQHFAAEVGGCWEGHEQLRHVDLWAAGRWLTCDDNIAFVPGLLDDVQRTARWLRSRCDMSLPFPGLSPIETHRQLLAIDDGSRERFWFPYWGPITDNLSGHLFRIDDQVVITLEFWRKRHPECGLVFTVDMPEVELLDVLDRMATALEDGE